MARKTFLLTLALALATSLCFAQESQAGLAPVSFSNNLIVARLAANGSQLNLFVNTGGGTFVTHEAIAGLGIPDMIDEAGNQFVELDPILSGSNAPITGKNEAIILPLGQGNLPEDTQGALGQGWFSPYCWTLDYQDNQLRCNQPPLSPLGAHTIPLKFRESSTGHRISNLPVITIEVDGMEFSVILDTGAKLLPSEVACTALADNTGHYLATSFITESFFDAWRSYHPEWQVVEQADREMGNIKMIKVPEITVAGQSAGPVWFCSRPDVEYTQYWSRFSGHQVEGALGGNALQYFRVTLDYPNKLAKFEQ